MLAVADGTAMANGQPIPLPYWEASSEDAEEAKARHALHISQVEWAQKRALKEGPE